MERTNQPQTEGNVVKEYMLGNTRIRICDDFFRGVSHEEGQKILNNGLTKACEALTRAYYDGWLSDEAAARLGYPAREVRT